MIKAIILACLIGISFSAKKSTKGHDVYEFKNSYVTSITKLNFDAQVKKVRESSKSVVIVHYYKEEGN